MPSNLASASEDSGSMLPSMGFMFGRTSQVLALVGGGLILDSGEAEHTFAFRCQERFLVYNTMAGLRTVLLTMDERHEARLQSLVGGLNEQMGVITSLMGLAAPVVPRPMYVRCTLRELRLCTSESFEAEARALAHRGEPVSFVANQVSPTTARLLGELARLLRERGVVVDFDAERCAQVAALALQWHNKAVFLALRADCSAAGGPPWVDTTVLRGREVLDRPGWPSLQQMAGRDWSAHKHSPDEVFFKSAQDSAGNLSTIASASQDPAGQPALLSEWRRWLHAEGFDAPDHLATLKAECALVPSLQDQDFDDALLAELRQQQGRRRADIALLAQPVLRPPAGAAGASLARNRPASVGVSLMVEPGRPPRLLAVNAQIFRDAQRRQFLGTMLDTRLEDDPLVTGFARECLSASVPLARRGWMGPVNFDGCLGEDGRYWFAGDCNPRLTALYVPLVVRGWLEARGVRVDSIASLGYRGEFVLPHPRRSLGTWAHDGLLFDVRRARGLLILPSLARQDGHDLMAINLPPDEATRCVERLRASEPAFVPSQLETLHV
jgi:hypothetical protein